MSKFIRSKLYKKLTQSPLTSSIDIESLKKLFIKSQYASGEHLLSIDGIEKKIKFLEKGIVHQYRLTESGELITINIAIPGMFFNSFTSYTLSNPSLQQQTAIREVEIFSISKEIVDELAKTNHAFCYYYMKQQQQIHLERELRSRILQTKSATARFEQFIELDKKAKYYLDNVPNKIVASYLNLTAETFSRVKSKHYS